MLVAYRDGFTASGTLVLLGPDAAAKGRLAGRLLLDRPSIHGYWWRLFDRAQRNRDADASPLVDASCSLERPGRGQTKMSTGGLSLGSNPVVGP